MKHLKINILLFFKGWLSHVIIFMYKYSWTTMHDIPDIYLGYILLQLHYDKESIKRGNKLYMYTFIWQYYHLHHFGDD